MKGDIADKALVDSLFAEYKFDIVEDIVRVMVKAPEKRNGEDDLPIPPYAEESGGQELSYTHYTPINTIY